MNKEIWKDIEGFEEHYQISNLGNAKNIKDKDDHSVSKKVNQIDPKTNNIIKTFKSMADAKRSLKICSNSISRCCKGKQELAGGYKWQFA